MDCWERDHRGSREVSFTSSENVTCLLTEEVDFLCGESAHNVTEMHNICICSTLSTYYVKGYQKFLNHYYTVCRSWKELTVIQPNLSCFYRSVCHAQSADNPKFAQENPRMARMHTLRNYVLYMYSVGIIMVTVIHTCSTRGCSSPWGHGSAMSSSVCLLNVLQCLQHTLVRERGGERKRERERGRDFESIVSVSTRTIVYTMLLESKSRWQFSFEDRNTIVCVRVCNVCESMYVHTCV